MGHCTSGTKARQFAWTKYGTALDKVNLCGTVKHSGGSVMFWGYIAAYGKVIWSLLSPLWTRQLISIFQSQILSIWQRNWRQIFIPLSIYWICCSKKIIGWWKFCNLNVARFSSTPRRKFLIVNICVGLSKKLLLKRTIIQSNAANTISF